MRPPILYLTIAFAAGLSAGLGGVDLLIPALLVTCGAALLWRRAPLGAALGVMMVAGSLWGGAARRERQASCAGQWSQAILTPTRAAVVQLNDPVPGSGGVADGTVIAGAC